MSARVTLMSDVVHVLDLRKWRLRQFWIDLAALSLLIVVGATVLFDMYWLGHTAYYAANIDATSVYERDQVFARLVGELFVLVLSIGWLSFRLVQGGYRGLHTLK